MLKDRDALLTKLIYEISVVLKFKVQQLDILEDNYVRQGWHDDDWEQRLVRRGLVDDLNGKAPISIQPTVPQANQLPYPSPPTQNLVNGGE